GFAPSPALLARKQRVERLVHPRPVGLRKRANHPLAGEAGALDHAVRRVVSDVDVGLDALDAEREGVLREDTRDPRRHTAAARVPRGCGRSRWPISTIPRSASRWWSVAPPRISPRAASTTRSGMSLAGGQPRQELQVGEELLAAEGREVACILHLRVREPWR